MKLKEAIKEEWVMVKCVDCGKDIATVPKSIYHTAKSSHCLQCGLRNLHESHLPKPEGMGMVTTTLKGKED